MKEVYLLEFSQGTNVVTYSDKVYTSKSFAEKLRDEYNKTYTDLHCEVVALPVDDFKTNEDLTSNDN